MIRDAWYFGCLLLTFFYIGRMLLYRRTWISIREPLLKEIIPTTSVSIIIPARNEAANIGNLLQDILQQNYPKELMEVIVIDDHSEDATYDIAVQFKARAFKLETLLPPAAQINAYKKRAIEQAVQKANGKLIITTDADCRVGSNWIKTIVAFYEQSDYKLIAAPVLLEEDHSLFEKFQVLDFCGMQAITAASLYEKLYNMANGANLAYEKAAFISVEGYKEIDTKASGDDMLLVYKIARQYNGSVTFLKSKEAIVRTAVMHKLGDFLQQRFRWTSKSGSYQDKRITLILALVFLFVLTIVINLFYALIAQSQLTAFVFFVQFLLKAMVDYFFLRSAVPFFNRADLMRTFPVSQLLHCWYIVFAGTLGNILPYSWKGRKTK